VKSHFSDKFFVLMDAPLRQLCPLFLGRGRMRFISITGVSDPGNTTQSQPGRHSGGAKPLERLSFLVPEQEHFFDLNFGSIF
jgi:hypothetical protein